MDNCSKVPSADIGALHLTEYFSPLSMGMSNQRVGIPSRLGRPAEAHMTVLDEAPERSGSTAGTPTNEII